MSDLHTHLLDFYTRHPISADQILAKLRAHRGDLDRLQPEALYPHDQDHYGGLAANDALAECAGIRQGLGLPISVQRTGSERMSSESP